MKLQAIWGPEPRLALGLPVLSQQWSEGFSSRFLREGGGRRNTGSDTGAKWDVPSVLFVRSCPMFLTSHNVYSQFHEPKLSYINEPPIRFFAKGSMLMFQKLWGWSICKWAIQRNCRRILWEYRESSSREHTSLEWGMYLSSSSPFSYCLYRERGMVFCRVFRIEFAEARHSEMLCEVSLLWFVWELQRSQCQKVKRNTYMELRKIRAMSKCTSRGGSWNEWNRKSHHLRRQKEVNMVIE